MLRKLRIKFIALIMGIVAVLMTCSFAAICYLDWQQSRDDADAALENALMQAAEHAPNSSEEGLPSIMPATRKGGPGEGGRPIPNAFIGVYRVEGDQLALVPEHSSGMMNLHIQDQNQQELAARPDGTGRIPDSQLYYMKRTYPDGSMVAVMYSGSIDHWKELAVAFAITEAAALAIFLLISIAFSRWALRPVEQAWDQQRQFVADASHDLKTPLAVIQANTSILLDEPGQSPEERERWLESTRYEAAGMQALVENLLLTASSKSIPRTSCDLSRVVERECLQIEPMAFDRSLDMEESIESDVRVAADESQMKRLAQILLENACKYADEDGHVSITLTADHPAERAHLTIANSGPGIPAQDLDRVFDRFYRGDAARTSHEGHGLGLAIARSIVEAAAGTISVESKAGLTSFTATLPLAT